MGDLGDEWWVILVLISVWDRSTRYCTYRRGRPSLLDLLSEFWLISVLYLLRESMHLSVEGLRPWDWSYPVLQYLREWPTPTVIIFDMSTVVKPQQPPPEYFESITHKRSPFKISQIAAGIHKLNKICEIRDEPYDKYNFYPEKFGCQFS